MSHVTKTLKLTDHVIEEVFAHLYKQSWMNILDFDNWAIGLADKPENALEWHQRNAISAPRYFTSFDCKSAENAKMVKEHFHIMGLGRLEETYDGEDSTNRFLYVYKTSI